MRTLRAEILGENGNVIGGFSVSIPDHPVQEPGWAQISRAVAYQLSKLLQRTATPLDVKASNDYEYSRS